MTVHACYFVLSLSFFRDYLYLILSSVRETELGAPFGFFAMTPVGVAASAVGPLYLALVGWRLLPVRQSAQGEARPPWRVFELTAPDSISVAVLLPRLRAASVRLLAIFRDGDRIAVGSGAALIAGDRLLVVSRNQQWTAAAARAGRTDEVAALVVFLLSPAADYISGTTVTIDGALSLTVAQGA